MKTVPPGELLEYRDGREGDVAPVRVERLPSGAVRVVVRYPKPALDRARARLLISAAAVATFAVMSWQLTTRAAWFGILLSFTQLGMTFAAVMLILWWRAGWVYGFEASPARLVLETRGRVFNHEREALREHVKDVRVHLNRRGPRRRDGDQVVRSARRRHVAGRHRRPTHPRCDGGDPRGVGDGAGVIVVGNLRRMHWLRPWRLYNAPRRWAGGPRPS